MALKSRVAYFLSKIYITVFFLLFIVFHNAAAYAVDIAVKNVLINEDDYLILDAKLRQRLLIESLEVYRVGDDFLIPVIAITGALELKTEIDISKGYIEVNIADSINQIDLTTGTSNFPFPVSSQTSQEQVWSSDDFDIYITPKVLGLLLNAELTVDIATLSLNIAPINKGYLFPNEKRLNRSAEDKQLRRADIGQKAVFIGEQVILDKYHIITPPTGFISFSSEKSSDDAFTYGGSLQLSSDLLYHSAYLSLNRSNLGDRINSSLRFTRTKESPYEKLALGISGYGFGDVSSSVDSFKSNSDSGVGAYFYSRSAVKTRKFASTFIEGYAVAGWEVELYHDGFFLAQQKVNERGRYRFDDIATHYGTNNFKIKLFGPYGEEEERVETLIIDGNRLKKGQHSFDGSILDSGSILLRGGLEKGFTPNSFHINYDTGLTDRFQLGLSVAQREVDLSGKMDQFVGVQLQTSLHNLLLNTEIMKQADGGIAGQTSGQGQLNAFHQYGFTYNYENDFSAGSLNSSQQTSALSTSIAGRFILGAQFSYRLLSTFNFRDRPEKPRIVSSLSWNIKGLSFSSSLNFNPDNNQGGYNSSGRTFVSGSINQWRLSSGINYQLTGQSTISTVNATLARRFDNRLTSNAQIIYRPNSAQNNRWSLRTTNSWPLANMSINASAEVDSNDDWNLSLGVNFSLGYDHVNNRFNITRFGAYGGGTLDLNAFLDRNSNNILDQNDLVLEGAKFGPVSTWQELATGATGRVVLQGLPSNKAVGFYGDWNEGVTPSVDSYNVYTHSGGYIQMDIPFTIKTDVAGFVSSLKRDQLDPVSNVKVELLTEEGQVIDSRITNFEGFFEFNGLTPGNYGFRVAAEALSVRHLVSDPGVLTLTTPERGGYLEMEGFLLKPETTTDNIKASAAIEFTEDNYDPAFFEDEYNGQIYVRAPKKANGARLKTTVSAQPLKTARLAAILDDSDAVITSPLGDKFSDNNEVNTNKRKPVVIPSFIATTPADAARILVNDDISKIWRLQFSAFSNQRNAQEFLLKHAGVIEGGSIEQGNNDKLYRLFSGAFSSREQAIKRAARYNASDRALAPIAVKSPELPPKINEQVKTQSKINTELAYTIQVASMSDASLIRGVIADIALDTLYIAHDQSTGSYQILVGEFANKEAAILASSKMPLNTPIWIRKIGGLTNRLTYNEFINGK
jgi:septal ring-binding cell division protein DamX